MSSILYYKIQSINVSFFECDVNISEETLSLNTSFNFEINAIEKAIKCNSEIQYKNDTDICLDMIMECIFNVEEKSFNDLIKDNKIEIPSDILQYLASISIGTARGEIHARAEQKKSTLKDYVLPPIDLTKIIKTPAIFDL